MIAVDTSAIVAIIKDEAERATFVNVLKGADQVLASSATIVEARIVAHRRGGEALVQQLNAFIAELSIEIVSTDAADADLAYSAFIAFGKGSGHPAQLNFGDLFAYALAKSRGVPLLYKGNDFARTDIVSAVN